MKLNLILVIIVILTGCKSNKINNLQDAQLASQGIMVGSIAWPKEGRIYSRLLFKFRSTTTNKEYDLEARPTFNIFYGRTDVEFSSPDHEGATFALSIPEGEYEFYNFSMISGEEAFWSSKQDYSIPFSISSNEVTYLGEIRAHVDSRKDFLGGTELLGGFWTIKDEHKRDLTILKNQQSNLLNSKIKTEVPLKKRKFTSLVLLPSERNK
jgi:hypothetical protein